MIKSFEELGETLAEIENRLSELENAPGYPHEDIRPTEELLRKAIDEAKQILSQLKQYSQFIDTLNSLRGEVVHLKNKVYEQIDKPKIKPAKHRGIAIET